LVASSSQRAALTLAAVLEDLLEFLELLKKLVELLEVVVELLEVVVELDLVLDRKLGCELDGVECRLERELNELDIMLDRELEILELATLDFKLELARKLDITNNELEELKTILAELDFELE
jgi:hypothetical protein